MLMMLLLMMLVVQQAPLCLGSFLARLKC